VKITGLRTFHADGGWRPFGFLKITTDADITGWAEFTESPRNRGLSAVLASLESRLIGEDPRAFGKISTTLFHALRLAGGGINTQAIAAIENACIDIAAKAANVPVYALFGGAYRTAVPLYWSHCGNFRIRHAHFFDAMGTTPKLTGLDSFRDIGREVRAKGYNAAKTNPVVFAEGAAPRTVNPGFIAQGMDYGWKVPAEELKAIEGQLGAMREGLGSDAALMMDINFGYRPEALRRVTHVTEQFDLEWLEIDLHEPEALAMVRRDTRTPIASYETLFGRRALLPFLQARAADIGIIDVLWNGFAESLKMAALAETYDVNIAPHNGNGPLSDLMAAHFAAAYPNFHIMEIDVDDVPWKDALLTTPRRIEGGSMHLSDAPGWGADINEATVEAHPWKGA